MAPVLRVDFDDGSGWEIPLDVIRASYAAHYGIHAADDADADALIDWAKGDMNWSDVAASARQIDPPQPSDYEDEWPNADMIVTEAV